MPGCEGTELRKLSPDLREPTVQRTRSDAQTGTGQASKHDTGWV